MAVVHVQERHYLHRSRWENGGHDDGDAVRETSAWMVMPEVTAIVTTMFEPFEAVGATGDLNWR